MSSSMVSFYFLDTLCSHFADGKAHGNLCRQFCVTGDLQPDSCQTFHAGKEVVFKAYLENQPVSLLCKSFMLKKDVAKRKKMHKELLQLVNKSSSFFH